MDISVCSNEEREHLRKYLRQTNVAFLADLIGNRFDVTKARIHSLEELGNLQTLWSEIGGLRTTAVKFRVRDVLNTLESPKCTECLRTIRDYMARISQIEMVITIVHEDTQELRIYDGNKRTLAYYETSKKQPHPVDFKFFLLRDQTLNGWSGGI